MRLFFLCVCAWLLVQCETPVPVDPIRTVGHPTAPTPQATQQLLLEHPLSPEALQTCWTQVETATGKIVDERDLLHAKKQLALLMATDKVMYHWCFYHMVDDLDRRLRSDERSLSDRVLAFYAGMKVLWGLARVLDDASEQGKGMYFTYLRDRYEEISRDVLGREVAPQGRPLDMPREKELQEMR